MRALQPPVGHRHREEEQQGEEEEGNLESC